MGESFASLPLISRATKNCSFSLVCLERRKPASPCSTRHSDAKAETDFTAAKAGERGKRFAHSIPSCRKQNWNLLLLKWGYLRGYPLDALLVTFLAREKSPVGDWTRRKTDSSNLPHSGTDNPSAPSGHLPQGELGEAQERAAWAVAQGRLWDCAILKTKHPTNSNLTKNSARFSPGAETLWYVITSAALPARR